MSFQVSPFTLCGLSEPSERARDNSFMVCIVSTALSLLLTITLDRSYLMGYKTGESPNIESDFGALRYGQVEAGLAWYFQ